jgi:plasmid stabilization system protein ParE
VRRRATFLASVRPDLDGILTYVARESGSVSAGQRFVAELRRRCHELAALPGTLGRARPELGSGLRSVSHKGCAIFFRYAGGRFEVINILEGHRDIEAFFSDGD